MRPARIEVQIEQLVLHGVPAGDRTRIAAALELELTRRLSDQALSPALARGARIEHIAGGEVRADARSGPDALGTDVARAVHRVLAR